MTQDITGFFDGTAIVPDRPLQWKAGQKLKVRIETVETPDSAETSGTYILKSIGAIATDMGVKNLAKNHKQIASPEPSDYDC